MRKRSSIAVRVCCWLAVVGALTCGRAAAADRVTVGMVRLPTAIFVALDRGYFAAESLTVTPVFSQSGAELVPELSTGRIDVAVASPGSALFNALAIGVSATIVADCWVAATTPRKRDYAYITARRELVTSGRFRSGHDARGLTFAITAHGQMTELFAATFLHRAGLRLSDVNVVELPFPDIEVAMRNGAVDMASVIEPYAAIATRDGISVDVAGIASLMPGYVQAVLLYGDRLTGGRRDIGRRFMRAFARANAYIRSARLRPEGRREIARIYQRYLPLADAGVYDRIGFPVGPADLSVDLAAPFGLAWQLRQYVAAGLVARVPALSRAVDNRFVTGSP